MPLSLQPPRMASIDRRRIAAPPAPLAERQLVVGREARSCAARRRTPDRSSIPARRRSSSTRPRPRRRPSRSSRGCWCASGSTCTTPGTRDPSTLRCRTLTCSAVVVAAAARRGRRDVGDERRRRVQRTPLSASAAQVDGSPDAGQRLVAFDRRHQVRRVVADVPDVGGHRRR